ncbi:MAG: class I SAM-dependent methyltransferase [Candidatus Zixiibacteriota bacterium]|nr:MAG: class I SAM-dependent methyltransferase [candidate division Zixibacteria bacterium]
MMKDVDRIKTMKVYYDKRAPWHDGCMGYTDRKHTEQLLRPIVETVIPYIASRTVLEIACGTGNWTEVLAKRASSVFAIDSSPAVLDIAGKKLEYLKNVTLKEADAHTLEGINGPFDVAFASDWWSHMPVSSIRPFLENLHKRLKIGSRIIFIDMMMREAFENETAYYDTDGNRVSLRTLPDGSEFEVIKNFPTREELAEILGNFSRDFTYLKFETLKRWMISYTAGNS